MGGGIIESKTLVRQLQALRAAPSTFRYSLTWFIDGVKRASLETELEVSVPGKFEADERTGRVSATVQMKQRGKADPALPQSFTFRFAPDVYYTDVPEEAMGVATPLFEVFFPGFLDAKEYPEAVLREGMKKGTMIPVLDVVGGFFISVGPLRLDELDGEWAKCEARPGWEGAPPSKPLPFEIWHEIKGKTDSRLWHGKYVISIKTLLPRSADLTMEYVKAKDGEKSQVFHLKLDPVK